MIQLYTNPMLLDFIKLAIDLPQDERDQIEALVGEPYDIDAVAVGNFMVQGPKWILKDDAVPIVAGGFKQNRPGVWRDYMLTSDIAWEKRYWFHVTRASRRCMDAMFASKQAHRIECIAPAARLEKFPEIERWYGIMGYHREGIRYGYCANGADAVAFVRVQH